MLLKSSPKSLLNTPLLLPWCGLLPLLLLLLPDALAILTSWGEGMTAAAACCCLGTASPMARNSSTLPLTLLN
jgi:hypothetical protein